MFFWSRDEVDGWEVGAKIYFLTTLFMHLILGMDVPVYNFGRLIPGISGVMNNFQFGEKIGEAMGLMNSLTTLNNRFSNWTLTI